MKSLFGVLILVVCGLARADGFSCDQIADKKVRAACQAQAASAAAAADTSYLDQFVAKSKAAVLDQLKDPESARFSSLLAGKAGASYWGLCGFVNSKNSYGGYVGAKRFFIRWSGRSYETVGDVWISDGDDPDYRLEEMAIVCNPQTAVAVK